MKINCSKVPFKDKGCHFVIGMLIYLPLLFMFNEGLAVSVTIFIAAAKEVHDEVFGKTGFDVKDLIATIALPIAITILLFSV